MLTFVAKIGFTLGLGGSLAVREGLPTAAPCPPVQRPVGGGLRENLCGSTDMGSASVVTLRCQFWRGSGAGVRLKAKGRPSWTCSWGY